MSYCTGEAGIEAAQASSAKNLLASTTSSSMPPPPVPADSVDDRKKKAEELFSKRRLGEGEVAINKEKLAQALSEERKRKSRGNDDDDRWGKKQRAERDLAMRCRRKSSVSSFKLTRVWTD